MTIETGKQRLADEATRLKKAWITAAIWTGHALEDVARDYLSVPAYESWPRKDLQKEVPLLREDFASLLEQMVEQPDSFVISSAARWMAVQFDRWQQRAGDGPMTVCTAQEFELRFGLLKIRSAIEVPPYAELLWQGPHSLAFRHPEYMLARDLDLLYSLFLDCESLLSRVNWLTQPRWAGGASEGGQALARAVIQTCFNLLESFVSGLARAHLLENPNLPADFQKKLIGHDKSLRQRIIYVPELIKGASCGLTLNTPPLDRLFGSIKHARDSFVHCEPGPQPAERSAGRIKEELFHDVRKELVDETVMLTSQVIRHLWRFLFEREGPRWLSKLKPDALKRDLRLTPVE